MVPEMIFARLSSSMPISTACQLPSSMRISTNMPTEMKKTARNTSRKGMMSAMTWCDESDSARARPARKAPRASDRPACAVTQAVPKTRAMMVKRNSSGERVWRMPRNRGLSRCLTNRNRPPRISADLTIAQMEKAPDCEPRSGKATRNRITQMSWKSRMPREIRPCAESISPRSNSNLRTIAVDDRAIAMPSTAAETGGSPSSQVPQATASIVVMICTLPADNNRFLSLEMRL